MRMRATQPRLRKRSRDRSISMNITLPPRLVIALDRIIADKGFSGPVDYFKSRIRLDGQLTLKLDDEHPEEI